MQTCDRRATDLQDGEAQGRFVGLRFLARLLSARRCGGCDLRGCRCF
jgi:hypothetical protein